MDTGDGRGLGRKVDGCEGGLKRGRTWGFGGMEDMGKRGGGRGLGKM